MSVFDDDRFKHILTDPKFRGVPRKEKKVVIDKRFKSMFTDKKFQLNYSVDKRGRPIKHSNVEDYHNFYQLASDSESSDDGEKSLKSEEKYERNSSEDKKDAAANEDSVELEQDENEKDVSGDDSKPSDDIDDEEEKRRKLLREKKKAQIKKDTEIIDEFVKSKISDETRDKLKDLSVDYARGGASLFTDSSSDEITSSDSEEEIVHDWGELDRDAERTDDATYRLAACNMDWDRVGAKDLIVLFNSFVPAGGIIRSVSIYPSEFGLERMKEEDLKGPTELVNLNKPDDSDMDSESDDHNKDNEEEDVSEENMEKLRQYQLKRLKYYYAVVEFDNANTANKVYTECDGMEYESSATKLDLRFIPDDMTFDHKPKEVCTELPDGGKYLPRIFANSALQQGTVRLTWDETDPDRIDIVRKAATGQLDEEKARAFVALSSEEEEDNDDDKEKKDEESDKESDASESEEGKPSAVEKYRSLLAEIQKKEEEKRKGKVEMEITWDLNAAKDIQEKDEKGKEEQMTPFERMMKKKRDKRKERLKKKSEDDLLSDDDLPSDVDLNDPFFRDELGPDSNKPKKKTKSKEFSKSDNESEIEQRTKAELDLLLSEDTAEDRGKHHFSLKKIQKSEEEANGGKKKKKRKNNNESLAVDDNFKIDLNDERFGALFSSHHYNINPADSQYKETRAMKEIINEKIKRRKLQDSQEEKSSHSLKSQKVSGLSPELSLLVKSVKTKTKTNK